jgi:hypothetical protein
LLSTGVDWKERVLLLLARKSLKSLDLIMSLGYQEH